MTENKTEITTAPVAAFLETVTPDRRRADAEALIALFTRLSSEPPAMFGPSIIGFGRRTYRTDSGREGEMPRLCFSPRKQHLVLYGLRGGPDAAALIDRLGKTKSDRGCVYVKTLDDIDLEVLEQLLSGALAAQE